MIWSGPSTPICQGVFEVLYPSADLSAIIECTEAVLTILWLFKQAIEELNIKQKYWKDLLTDDAFTRKDIIHLQDPLNLAVSPPTQERMATCCCLGMIGPCF